MNVVDIITLSNDHFYFYPPIAILVIAVVVARRKKKEKARINSIITAFEKRNDFNDVNDLFWYVAREVIGKLGFDDCVIYKVDPEHKICEQVAASGPKSPAGNKIVNPIIIHFGKGIVGSVALSGKSELITNTTKDARYVADDDVRYSEVTVPVIIDDKVVAIIDSEAYKVNHFKGFHLDILQQVALVFASKLRNA